MSSLSKFEELVPRVAQNVVGCPDPVIVLALRDAAIELCDKSGIWRDYSNWQNLLTGQDTIKIVVPRGTEISYVHNVYFYKQEINLIRNETAASGFTGFPDFYDQIDPTTKKTDKGAPIAMMALEPGVLHPLPIPDKDYLNAFRAFCSFKPTLTGDGWPKDLMSKYYKVLIHGALKDLLSQQQKAWTNQDLARKHELHYNFGCQRARANVNLGNVRNRLAVDTRRAGLC